MQNIPLVNHIQPLSEWLSTYPPFAAYPDSTFQGLQTNNMDNADRLSELGGSMNIIAFDPNAQVGANMLQNTDSNDAIVEDIIGIPIEHSVVTFMLFARRFTNDNFWRREGAEFLSNLSKWTERQRYYGKQPKFGNIDLEEEKIKITGGMPWQQVENRADLTDYMWQLQVTYKTKLPPKEN